MIDAAPSGSNQLSVVVDQHVLASAVAAVTGPLPKPADPLRSSAASVWLGSDGLHLAGASPTLTISVRVETLEGGGASGASPEALAGSAPVLVPWEVLAPLARRLSRGPVELRFDEEAFRISAGRFHASVGLLDGTLHDAPREPVAAHTVLRIEDGRFWDAVRHVAFGAGATRDWLMGSVRLEVLSGGRLRMFSTDKDYSAVATVDAHIETDGLGGEPVLVPVESVVALDKVVGRLEHVDLRIGDAQIDVIAGSTCVRGAIGGPPMPRFEVIAHQRSTCRLSIERSTLADLIRRLQFVSRRHSTVLWIEWNGDEVIARSELAELAEVVTTLSASVVGAPFEIGLNLSVLASMVQRMGDGTVAIAFDQPDRIATLINEGEPDLVYYAGLMAVRRQPWALSPNTSR